MVSLYHKLSANGLHINGSFYPSEATSDETVFVSKVPEGVANIYEEQGTGSRNPETFLPPSQGASAQEVAPEVAPKAKPGRKPRQPKVATPDSESASRSEDEEGDGEAPEDTQPEVTE